MKFLEIIRKRFLKIIYGKKIYSSDLVSTYFCVYNLLIYKSKNLNAKYINYAVANIYNERFKILKAYIQKEDKENKDLIFRFYKVIIEIK